MAAESHLSNRDFDSLSQDQQDLMTRTDAPSAPAADVSHRHSHTSDVAAYAAFSHGDSGEVSSEELDRRRAEGLAAPFDDDDDDLDEDLRPSAEREANDEPGRPQKNRPQQAKRDKQAGAEGSAEADEAERAGEAEADDETAASGETEADDADAAPVDAERAELEERARQYGLDVARFADAEALEASVAAIDRMFHDIGAAEYEATLGAGGPAAGDDLSRPGLPPHAEGDHRHGVDSRLSPNAINPAGDRRQKAGEFKLDRLDREEYAPALIEALDEMRNVIAELRSEHQSERARRAEADQLTAEREIDGYFAEIAQDNPVWSELFGTAPAAELLRTTEGRKLFENRMNVLRARDNYAAGLESRRRPTPGSRKLLESGLALAFREKLGEAAERKLARKLQGRLAGAPPRPTQRQSPRRHSGSALREALKRHGMEMDTDQ